MKVFISWSGDLSKDIAEIFREWIPGVIQAVKPYYTPDDITKGTRWNNEISKELDASKIGIVCLTKDNLSSPWIMFETGALSKNIDDSKVCPILFGIEPSDIKGPLVHFQAAKFSKTEMKKLINMINSELGEFGLESNVLDNVFQKWWPELESKITEAMKQEVNVSDELIRSDRDILEEVLTLTRRTSRITSGDRNYLLPSILIDVINSLSNLIGSIETNSLGLSSEVTDLVDAINFLLQNYIEDFSSSDKNMILNKWGLLHQVFGSERKRKVKIVGKINLDDIKTKTRPNK